jgi:hypothetical protein
LMTVQHLARDVLALRFETGTNLELTPAHRLFIEGSGWLPAGELEAGQLLRSDYGPVRLDAIEPAQPNQRVFNLEGGLEHTYRVSADRILTHNASCGWEGILEALTDAVLAGSRKGGLYIGTEGDSIFITMLLRLSPCLCYGA